MYPAHVHASAPVAPHSNARAAVGECASCSASRKPADTIREPHCITLRVVVTLTPRWIIQSANDPATLPTANIESHGAAENRPECAMLSPCVPENGGETFSVLGIEAVDVSIDQTLEFSRRFAGHRISSTHSC